jgi:flagellar biosynthesis component FlhA
MMLDPMLEDTLPTKNYNGLHVVDVGRERQEQLIQAIKEEIHNAKALHIEPVLVVQTPELRPALSRLVQNYELTVSVISIYEIAPSVPNKIIGYIKLKEE